MATTATNISQTPPATGTKPIREGGRNLDDWRRVPRPHVLGPSWPASPPPTSVLLFVPPLYDGDDAVRSRSPTFARWGTLSRTWSDVCGLGDLSCRSQNRRLLNGLFRPMCFLLSSFSCSNPCGVATELAIEEE